MDQRFIRGARDRHSAEAIALARGGWLIVDGVDQLSADAARLLSSRVEEAEHECRWVLAGRHWRSLPYARWLGQRRLWLLDARALALTPAEWEVEGLPRHL